MLKPASSGSVGFTRGRGMKLGLGLPIDPLSDSKEAIKRYIYTAAKKITSWGSSIPKRTVVASTPVFKGNGGCLSFLTWKLLS